MRVCLRGTIDCLLRNVPTVSASATDVTTFLVFGRQLGWDPSVLAWACWWLLGDR